MKATEFKGQLSGIRMTHNARYRSHSGLHFKLGNAIPTHVSQLRKFNNLQVLCQGDVDVIEGIFNASNTGKTGDYQFTKSKTFVRLNNFEDFKTSLKVCLENGLTF